MEPGGEGIAGKLGCLSSPSSCCSSFVTIPRATSAAALPETEIKMYRCCMQCLAEQCGGGKYLRNGALQVDMKKNNPGQDEQLKTCWSTMLKYLGNIARVSAAAPISSGISLYIAGLHPLMRSGSLT